MVLTNSERNITWHEGTVTKSDREQVFGHKGVTIWLTGLSGSGKSTVAVELEKRLLLVETKKAYVLDGDNIRFGLNKDLGFSATDRTENIRRISEVSKLFADAGVIFFVDAPLSVAEQRDPKGLYAKARKGEIKEFTGISAPYEKPESPEIILKTDQLEVSQSVDKIIEYLRQKELV
ncbi:hypothetical protein BB558_002144 [Smittium angustum]|uniref:ATP adenosine-5'-phosphosulfate 3'-phosphotransferase n=1 Tax=Smittium angustum TaxID=133377 RepID=A0A2U1J9E7_SMIAN|nr:hypothetical protein BB558_002144 [Smittium angustum]